MKQVITWGGPNYDSGEAISFANNGNIIYAGLANEIYEGDRVIISYADFSLRSINPDGSIFWSKEWNEQNGITLKDVLIDAEGNIYTTGTIFKEVEFDPVRGIEIHSLHEMYDAFVTKFTSSGEHLWTRQWGSIWDISPSGLAISNDGEILISGSYSQTVDFDPGEGEILKRGDGSDLYLLVLDSDGNFRQVLEWGSGYWDYCTGPVVGNEGNIYIAGTFSGSGDFDPGEGEAIVESIGNRDCNDGTTDVFISKFTSDYKHQWTKVFGGDGSEDVAELAVKNSGEILVSGGFHNIVDFDPGPGVESRESFLVQEYDMYYDMYNIIQYGQKNAYLSEFTPDGSFNWVQTWGGASTVHPRALYIGHDETIFVAGGYFDEIRFPDGANRRSANSNGRSDIFLCIFNPDGTCVGASSYGGKSDDYLSDMMVDDSSNIFLTGTFSGSWGSSGLKLRSIGNLDAFLLKLTTQ